MEHNPCVEIIGMRLDDAVIKIKNMRNRSVKIRIWKGKNTMDRVKWTIGSVIRWFLLEAQKSEKNILGYNNNMSTLFMNLLVSGRHYCGCFSSERLKILSRVI